MTRHMSRLFAATLFMICLMSQAYGQGVTTGAISGTVHDAQGQGLAGASVIAVHRPSGTQYGALTRADGRYTIPNMRVGGPYRVTVSHIGYEAAARENVTVNLGSATVVDFTASERAVEVAAVTVTAAAAGAIMSPERTGASTTVSKEVIETLPTISRRIEDFARLTPQYSGAGFGYSFAGQDNRLNNTTVDGSYFNNSFGLAGQPGDRTGVAPISIDAIEQVQVSIAPYDVRQGNFVGAGVNSVTRSGTNNLAGSLYYYFRNENFYGKKAGAATFDPGTFDFHNLGGWISGPIVRNKLFFFASFENENNAYPGTTWRANTGSEPVTGQVTRVKASDLDQLSEFLRTKFKYETGPYQGYNFTTPAKRYLAKLDYAASEHSKFSLRFTDLESSTDVLASTSSSLGAGFRRSSPNALNFANTNYSILENIRSIIGEWNTTFGSNKANNLIVGYTYQDESRGYKGDFFPLVDILESTRTYTSFGFEPFTPSNQLRYKTAQLQDNFTIFKDKHTLTFGATAQRYHSDNVFFFGSQSAYVYNSLADFYTDANDYLANPNRTVSPVTLNKFQVSWSNIPGQAEPRQPLSVTYAGLYAQDEMQLSDRLRLTVGIRADAPWFDKTGYQNPQANSLSFRDETGATVKYQTEKLPNAKIHWSPRVGFNYDVTGDRSTQLRGGTGIFTGQPAYVWISNQIGNNGILTGFETVTNTRNRPFHPDPNHYKPANVTGQPATSYQLALTDPNFKFPQLWRSDVAVDQRLPFGLVGTAEFLYNKDVNGIYYINANLPASNATLTGPDARPLWTASNRINSNIVNAIVLKNQNQGYSWNASASLQKTFAERFFAKLAYSYGVSKNTVDPGSIASGTWGGNPVPGDPNNAPVAFSSYSPGNRLFLATTYRANWLRFGGTTVGLFLEGANQGRTSYIYSTDFNGDGQINDLIYVPRDASEMNFKAYTSGGKTFTAAEQQAAFEAFIQQNAYLRKHRGQIAERNAIQAPMVWRADLNIAQDLFTNIRGKRNTLQVRADILNVGNLLNKNWGVGQSFATTRPLTPAGKDASGNPVFTVPNQSGTLIDTSFRPTAGLGDIYRLQLSLRYRFE